VPGAGHMIPVEQPKLAEELIAGFLAKVRP
jgi:hypothetical protein